MSFIVSGLPMPKTCAECPCLWEDAECWSSSYCQAGSDISLIPMDDTPLNGRPDDCPLRDSDEVILEHYRQGRLDEAAEREGQLIQSFSPD